jgi:non-heme chloroperoxidase
LDELISRAATVGVGVGHGAAQFLDGWCFPCCLFSSRPAGEPAAEERPQQPQAYRRDKQVRRPVVRQMLFLAQHGFRVVAHDRRGHGRSSQASSGNDMDGYADDLAAVIEALDLRDATLVGHSTGGGEVARYIGRHGTGRVAKAVLVSAVPPLMLKTAANPEGTPLEVLDGLRAGLAKDRSQFYKEFAIPFYGANRPGAEVSQGVLDQFWLWSMQSGLKNAYESIKAFSETDFTEDLEKFDVPTLVLHSEDDQVVPVHDSARKSARLIKDAKEVYYPGAPHGLTATHQDQFNADLLAFLRS